MVLKFFFHLLHLIRKIMSAREVWRAPKCEACFLTRHLHGRKNKLASNAWFYCFANLKTQRYFICDYEWNIEKRFKKFTLHFAYFCFNLLAQFLKYWKSRSTKFFLSIKSFSVFKCFCFHFTSLFLTHCLEKVEDQIFLVKK